MATYCEATTHRAPGCQLVPSLLTMPTPGVDSRILGGPPAPSPGHGGKPRQKAEISVSGCVWLVPVAGWDACTAVWVRMALSVAVLGLSPGHLYIPRVWRR